MKVPLDSYGAGLVVRPRGANVGFATGDAMRTIFLLLALLAAAVGAIEPVEAADMRVGVRPAALEASRVRILPFPRRERAAAVWNERACWAGCQSYCTWGEAACLELDTQGRCLRYTDRCDRTCQRDCRSRGGPLVAPILGLLD